MSKSVKYPNIIFVRQVNPGTEAEYYEVNTNLWQCAAMNEINNVAMYALDHKIEVTGTISAKHGKSRLFRKKGRS